MIRLGAGLSFEGTDRMGRSAEWKGAILATPKEIAEELDNAKLVLLQKIATTNTTAEAYHHLAEAYALLNGNQKPVGRLIN